MHVTELDIIKGLRSLSVCEGANIIVHSSLRNFGHVAGGAQEIIRGLMKTVTEKGTLMMPSFNHGDCLMDNICFDPKTTETCNGVIPSVFWKMDGVERSLEPSHTFAVWGKNAKKYTQFHHRDLTMGRLSPLGQLYQDDGECVLLGVGYEANTFHHYVEQEIGAKCIGWRTEVCNMRLADGRIVEGRTWGWRDGDCYFTDKARYAQIMEAQNLHRKGKIGDAEVIVFRLRDCYDVVMPLLEHGIDGQPPCRECNIRPTVTEWTRESDWDFEKRCLKPDSKAWEY